MSSQLRIKCPSCQATLQVSVEKRGKVVGCPKCQARFRLPDSPPAEELPPMALPVESEGDGIPWGDQSGFPQSAPQPRQPATAYGAPPQNYPTQRGYHQPTYPSHASLQQPKPMAAGVPGNVADHADLSESDSNLQSTGIFLLVIPILAAILPLFGLQLRRLAKAGEFAPLGAMLLGFIGAGLIVYARRKRRDAPLVGVAAVFVTLFFGVGGFMLQSWALEDEPAAIANNADANQDAADVASNIQEMNRRTAERAAENMRQSRERAEQMRNNAMQSMAGGPQPPSNSLMPNFPDANSSAGTGATGSNSATSSGNDASGNASRFFGQFENQLKQDNSLMGMLMRASSDGRSAYSRVTIRERREVDAKNFVGQVGHFGRLYNEQAVEGVCGYTLGSKLEIVPISSPDPRLQYTVMPGSGEQLYGLRFAFDGDKIVGYQGLLKSTQTSAISEGQWYGRETPNVKESLNPSPGEMGIICYEQRNEFCGFGWVDVSN